MIKLNFGTRSYPLNEAEAVFVAESLLAAVSGKKAAHPSFSSGMHGHISVLTETKQPGKGDKQNFRSNPQQSDHVLTNC